LSGIENCDKLLNTNNLKYDKYDKNNLPNNYQQFLSALSKLNESKGSWKTKEAET